MHVEERGRRRLELGQRARRDRDEVADARHLEQHRRRRPSVRAPCRAASRSSLPPPCVRARRHADRAAPSRGGTAPAPRRRPRRPASGRAASPRRACTIFCTCSLSAPPQPATASFTWFGVYCTTSHPAAAASASASPLAWPTLIAVRTLTWKNTCSTATTAGAELGDQRRQLAPQLGQALRQRVGRRGAHAHRATARATVAGGGRFDRGVPAPGQPGVDPEHDERRTAGHEHAFDASPGGCGRWWTSDEFDRGLDQPASFAGFTTLDALDPAAVDVGSTGRTSARRRLRTSSPGAPLTHTGSKLQSGGEPLGDVDHEAADACRPDHRAARGMAVRAAVADEHDVGRQQLEQRRHVAGQRRRGEVVANRRASAPPLGTWPDPVVRILRRALHRDLAARRLALAGRRAATDENGWSNTSASSKTSRSTGARCSSTSRNAVVRLSDSSAACAGSA